MFSCFPIEVLTKSSGGGNGYHASAVHFDGNTAVFSTTLTGVTDSSQGLWSLWYKTAQGGSSIGPTNAVFVFPYDNSGCDGLVIQNNAGVGSIGNPTTYLQDNLDNNDISIYANVNASDNNWHNFIVSANVNFASGMREIQLVHDGVLQTPTVLFEDGGAFNIDFSHGCSIGLVFGHPDIEGVWDCADVMFWPGTLVDLSNVTNVQKFIAGGKPVNPATAVAAFGTPAVLLSGDHTSFVINQGTGGVFTLTGTLTDATSSPSD